MKRFAFAAVVLAYALSGCGGCDDSPGQTNNRENNTVPQACEDRDGDGTPSGLTCDGPVDCNDDDPDVNQDAEEVCDGVDNNCDGTVDEGCDSCDEEGATRDCGSDVGRCVMGIETCVDGAWTDCEGDEGPFSETCNGQDDDCDGEVDETGDMLCDDGVACNGAETCQDGACVAGDAPDCSEMDGPCVEGICSEKDGGCKAAPRPNGSSCEDGSFCTETGTCNLGVCETTPRDCSSEDDACNVGVCDEENDACVKQPVSDGTTCDDGEYCTVNDSCNAGTCGGQTRDCSGEADQCNDGVCDETADACVKQPVTDGTACDDDQYCNVGETCQAGQCMGGSARDCSAQGGSCRTGQCDEATDSCDGDPVADGTPCDDSEYCTVNDTCLAGTCEGGGPRDCSSADGVCKVGSCAENLNTCVSTPAPDGSACDDGAFCTENDTCQVGSCSGTARDCSGVADACNAGSCNESMDACVQQPVSDGTSCPDALFCTVSEVCQAGTCSTQPRDCSTNANQCNDSVCDDSANACVADPLPDGTDCEDGQYCTDGDTCQSGICQSGGPLDCSGATGGDPCLTAMCDEGANACETMPNTSDPMCCDPMVDADLDGSNECDDCDDSNGAVYPGAMEFCNGFDDDCDGSIDEDFDNDGDGYSVCSTDPDILDCDDSDPNVNPGMGEICDDGAGGDTGNGIDDDCDGYVDEGCNPCTDTDADNDGASECDGDCDDSDPTMYPGAPELCDGKDNDCNVFTRPNCGVSDTCNHDGDGDYSNDPDLCREDMICACEVNNSGSCTGNYFCTSFCNTSDTGALGDGCTSTQTCQYDLLRSGAVHGCGERSDVPGTAAAGETCSGDDDCRSLNCVKLNLAGPPDRRCLDYCGSDAYCDAAGTSCRLFLGEDGRCYPDSYLGSSGVGTSCTSDDQCDHGFCATDPDDGSRYCTEPCCADSDCPGGYTCSLRGDSTDTTYVFPPPNATSCGTAADCGPDEGDVCFNGECAWRLVDTGTMCIKDDAGQGANVAGQTCTQNSDCASNFCELDLGVCIDVCCADSTCPQGLECQFVTVETTGDRATSARVCLNLSTDGIIRRR